MLHPVFVIIFIQQELYQGTQLVEVEGLASVPQT